MFRVYLTTKEMICGIMLGIMTKIPFLYLFFVNYFIHDNGNIRRKASQYIYECNQYYLHKE